MTGAVRTGRYSPSPSLLTLLLLLTELPLGEVDVDGDVHGAKQVVVLVVWHAFALLADPRPGPGDLLTLHAHLVPVQVLCREGGARQMRGARG